ncbi:Na+/H+ antiporter NhaA [Sphingobium phenoxybenzoativorans]|uniref:Na(+)/H(+) antiporter NhaA n=1 Tax=Sphingobium phenoxybenzoativorans TaxID=1592790 RepID=A0A975Q1E5_9SPHN|nr:Na+/H+ antiporter NhaA [Sphingobium phenoxybenzoativorans]QUT05307.1 Na+/H+ antiporter NhaA [Sphingobium phenoxybenzoativorans]
MSNSKPLSALRSFLASEAGGGVILIFAAAMALVAANISENSAHLYHALIHADVGPVLTRQLGSMTVHLWINDGLMALFFLLVGLEIKREIVDGRLSSWERRLLPAVAAASGMAVPAIIYLWIAGGNAALANGWAIPAATDIAFAIGVMALLGSRAPMSLKLFLVTVAIVDDMGAVVVIALFYTQGLSIAAIGAALLILIVMYGMNRMGVRSLTPYLLAFTVLWYAILVSGVHATIAGVLAALTIPIRRTPGTPDAEDSPLHRLEHALHPWSAYLIVPLFGFANAGLNLGDVTVAAFLAPLPLGICLALFLGKQIGIFGSVWTSVRLGLATKPRGATWAQIYGVALLCGIGFTMSLFIGGLAFPGAPEMVEKAKLGILAGSLLSALAGFAVLRFAPLHPDHAAIEAQLSGEIDGDGDIRS